MYNLLSSIINRVYDLSEHSSKVQTVLRHSYTQQTQTNCITFVCTMPAQRLRRWTNIAQMSSKYFCVRWVWNVSCFVQWKLFCRKERHTLFVSYITERNTKQPWKSIRWQCWRVIVVSHHILRGFMVSWLHSPLSLQGRTWQNKSAQFRDIVLRHCPDYDTLDFQMLATSHNFDKRWIDFIVTQALI